MRCRYVYSIPNNIVISKKYNCISAIFKIHYNLQKKKEEESEKDHEKSDASKSKTESDGGLGNLGSLGLALVGSLMTNTNKPPEQQPSQQPNDGVLGSILGALGTISHITIQKLTNFNNLKNNSDTFLIS